MNPPPVDNGGGDGSSYYQTPVYGTPGMTPVVNSGDPNQAASSLMPIAMTSPYAWSQLSPTTKLAIIVLGVATVGGGYYMWKRRK